jgi:hypothetical protein
VVRVSFFTALMSLLVYEKFFLAVVGRLFIELKISYASPI